MADAADFTCTSRLRLASSLRAFIQDLKVGHTGPLPTTSLEAASSVKPIVLMTFERAAFFLLRLGVRCKCLALSVVRTRPRKLQLNDNMALLLTNPDLAQ